VIVVGIAEGEGSDRADLDLPGKQERLINAVAATGVPTIVVFLCGSPVTMRGWLDGAGAVLDAWYGGEEGGNAIADVLFGDENPGGKLPITFPRSVGQVPLYYELEPSGRGYDYTDMSGKPLYPFGYGLSYTTFEYRNLRITPSIMKEVDTVSIGLDVRNTGARRGEEIVQCYLHDSARSVIRPLKELKAFRRIMLDAGELKSVTFKLSKKDLEFYDHEMRPVVEPGLTRVMIGSSSADIRLEGEFTIGVSR
jgi:beta-glucosidase